MMLTHNPNNEGQQTEVTPMTQLGRSLTLYSGLRKDQAIAKVHAIGREERKLRAMGATGNYAKWYFQQEFQTGEMDVRDRMRTFYKVVVELL
jgi:hypothetical protein